MISVLFLKKLNILEFWKHNFDILYKYRDDDMMHGEIIYDENMGKMMEGMAPIQLLHIINYNRER